MDGKYCIEDLCSIAQDITVDGKLAFKKDETVLIEAISANTDRPEYKYVVHSGLLKQHFHLREIDLLPVEKRDLVDQTGDRIIQGRPAHEQPQPVAIPKQTVAQALTGHSVAPKSERSALEQPPSVTMGKQTVTVALAGHRVAPVEGLAAAASKEPAPPGWKAGKVFLVAFGILILIFVCWGAVGIYHAVTKPKSAAQQKIIGEAQAGDAHWTVLTAEKAKEVPGADNSKGTFILLQYHLVNEAKEAQTPYSPTIYDASNTEVSYDPAELEFVPGPTWGVDVVGCSIEGDTEIDCFGVYQVPANASSLKVVVSGWSIMNKQQAEIKLPDLSSMKDIQLTLKTPSPSPEASTPTPAPAATASDYSQKAGDLSVQMADITGRFIDTNSKVTQAEIDLTDYPSIEAGQTFMNDVAADALPEAQAQYNDMRAIQKQAEALSPPPELQESHGMLLKAIDCYCRAFLENVNSIGLLQNINSDKVSQSTADSDRCNALMTEGTSYMNQASAGIPSLKH